MESSCSTAAESEGGFNSEPRKLRPGPVLAIFISSSWSPGSENAAQTSNEHEHEHAQQLHGVPVLQS